MAAPLSERLVDAVDHVLADDGLGALSLREVARRAGVTHGAPLRHYASFATLLSEVAARGFRTLADSVDSAAALVPADAGPTARLAAAARAYVDCAMKQPGRFALMFRPELLDAEHPTFQTEATRAFESLVRLVRGAQDSGWRREIPARELAGSLWASMHGLASLWTHGAYAGAVPGVSLETSLQQLITLILGADPGAARANTRRRRR
jgi:AcrR family transcriptional regulator